MQQSPDHRSSPWHTGEKTLQEKAGVAERMEAFGQKVIRDHMPDQHRTFITSYPSWSPPVWMPRVGLGPRCWRGQKGS